MATPKDAYKDTNARVRAIAEENRWRTRRNGDGELVIRLQGDRDRVAYLGLDGSDRCSLVILGHTRPASAVRALRRVAPGLEDKSTEHDLWVSVVLDEGLNVLRHGPRCVRARRKKTITPDLAVSLARRLPSLHRTATPQMRSPGAATRSVRPPAGPGAPSRSSAPAVGPEPRHEPRLASAGRTTP